MQYFCADYPPKHFKACNLLNGYCGTLLIIKNLIILQSNLNEKGNYICIQAVGKQNPDLKM